MQAIAGYTSATHKPIKFCTQKRIVCPTRFDTLNTYVDRYIQCVIHKNGIKHDIVRTNCSALMWGIWKLAYVKLDCNTKRLGLVYGCNVMISKVQMEKK